MPWGFLVPSTSAYRLKAETASRARVLVAGIALTVLEAAEGTPGHATSL